MRPRRLASLPVRMLPSLWMRKPMAVLLPDRLRSLRASSAAHHPSLVILTVLCLLPAIHLHKSFGVHLLSPAVSLWLPVKLILLLQARRQLVEHRHQVILTLLVVQLAVVRGSD